MIKEQPATYPNATILLYFQYEAALSGYQKLSFILYWCGCDLLHGMYEYSNSEKQEQIQYHYIMGQALP